jgi:pyruvate/2-oxoglutarate dehydrogenase complex dihydrolipoamide dehydrogenase (E3) component
VEADEVLCALGRKPNVAGLGMDHAGIQGGKAGVPTNARQQTQNSHIFAAGDVCGPHEVVHIAIQQAELAARNAARLLGKLKGEMENVDYALKLFVVFTHPEVAMIGLTKHEAALLRYDVRVAKYAFCDHGKAMVRGETDGFVKLMADEKTRRILGAACVGPEASELIHEIAAAMYFSATARDLADIPHYHPTLSEIWTYPAEELAS